MKPRQSGIRKRRHPHTRGAGNDVFRETLKLTQVQPSPKTPHGRRVTPRSCEGLDKPTGRVRPLSTNSHCAFQHGHRIGLRHLKLHPVPCGNIERKHLRIDLCRADRLVPHQRLQHLQRDAGVQHVHRVATLIRYPYLARCRDNRYA